jgi:hypothetical protein
MTERASRRESSDAAVAAVLPGQIEIRAYQLSLRQARRGTADATNRARPLEFDERGFPIAQHNGSFLTRVTRLLSL